MSGSREDAEDLVQETFEHVLRRPRLVQRDRDLAYLLRALRHTCAAHARAADAPPDRARAPGGARVDRRRPWRA